MSSQAKATGLLSVAASTSRRPITGRKQAEAVRYQLASIVESSGDAIMSGTAEGVLLTWNAGAERIYGYPAEEVKGRSISILFRPSGRAQMSEILQRIQRGERIEQYETVGMRKDGTEIPVACTISPIKDAEGNVKGASLIARDITRRKRAEAEIRAKNRDLETLLCVTSHDLKEPLRTIESFSRMVRERYGDRLDDKGLDFLGRVIRGARRMNRLLDDILTVSRLQRIAAPTQEVEGESIVRDALSRLEGQIRETRARVRVATDLPPLVAERTWATQAVYNLIANALKFKRDGEAPDIEVTRFERDGEVGIVVRDRGPGVAPEHAERIFQLFQRAVGREVEGTGAGLAIVKQVAERHGGRAWVEPRNGGGSEFIITFGRAGNQEGESWP